MLKHYFIEVFEPTLLFGLLNAFLGVVAAAYYGHANFMLAALVIIGVVLAQIAVNLFDDYIDYNNGIDKETVKTKFSGGSELVVKHLVKLNYVLYIAVFATAVAALIGIFIAVHNIYTVPAFLFGAILLFFYAKYLTKIPYVTEPAVAVAFILVGAGSFIACYGSVVNLPLAILAFVPAGMAVGLVSIANSMPDRKADKKHGRRNGVIMLGDNGKAADYYMAMVVLSFVVVLAGIALGLLPFTFLITLAVIPGYYYVYRAIGRYKNPRSFEKAMGVNALMGLILTLLLSVAYLILM